MLIKHMQIGIISLLHVHMYISGLCMHLARFFMIT